jgi:ankyrin repeat protein
VILASLRGFKDITKLLLLNNASINIKDKNEFTPLVLGKL